MDTDLFESIRNLNAKGFEIIAKMEAKLGNEIWKRIEGYDHYEVSNMGNVRNVMNGGLLSLRTQNSSGYCIVALYSNTIRQLFQVHRLVAEAFVFKAYDVRKYVDHLDNNKRNNNANNLRWCTPQENSRNCGKSLRNTSGVIGVHWDKRNKKWRAMIRNNLKKKIHLGLFANIDDAKQARQQKAKELFGEFINKCEL